MRILKNVFIILVSFFISFSSCLPAFAATTDDNDLTIHSKAAILMDLDSGNILYSKNINERVFPASVTKVLTAILAIKNLNLSDSVVVSKTALDLPYGSSNAALKVGEVISVENLLYALLLKSGNDCANVLAEAVAGNIDDFIVMMNEKALELGCLNTNFSNPHGYHDENHYTTPSDMMKIFKYALNNSTFVKICGTSSYSIPATNKTNDPREYVNTNRLITNKSEDYLSKYYEYCVCGKTGYTDEAGRTFVGYAKNNDYNLVLGVFDVMDVDGTDGRYVDAVTLFEYGFNNFEKQNLLSKSDYPLSYYDYERNLKFDLKLENNIDGLVLKNSSLDKLGISSCLNVDAASLKNVTRENFQNKITPVGNISFEFQQSSYSFNTTSNVVIKNVTKINDFKYYSSIVISACYYICYAFIFVIIVFVIIVIMKKNNLKKTRQVKRVITNSKSITHSKNKSLSERRRQKKF